MAIAMLVDNPDGSQEIYESVRAHLGWKHPPVGSSMLLGRARTEAGGCSKCGSRRRTRGDSETSA